MSYSATAEMATSASLLNRIAACAADEGVTGNAMATAQANAWQIVAAPGWAEAWDYAVGEATVNVNPDTGARDDVITDAMILSAVQAFIASETTA